MDLEDIVNMEIRTYTKDLELVSERRKHIMDCASKVFLEKGYRGSNMRNLAEACAMSTVSIYHYIGSKNDILHLLCLDASDLTRQLEDFRSQLDDVSPTEALIRCIKYYFNREATYSDRVILFQREISNFSHEDRHLILSLQIEVVHFFENLLKEGINAGEFKVDDPLLVAHDILMRGQDYAFRRWFLKNIYTIEEYTEHYINLILRCIVADRSEETTI
jgi:AcrR family transcriptional regulator